ncbi:uncharacterized protein LOC131009677 [Salvia miltiorrhiza]|uniref:uncharacterized protein LOC131009677 n=1 Tax=Salvia miltiorrhiza TaxID=226208 RepID=UPI0025ACBC33|nr:uncharacterized protein LOC131009677 [Salvia miltiorrhiza]
MGNRSIINVIDFICSDQFTIFLHDEGENEGDRHKVVDDNVEQNVGGDNEWSGDDDVDYYPSESEEIDDELIDIELSNDNDDDDVEDRRNKKDFEGDVHSSESDEDAESGYLKADILQRYATEVHKDRVYKAKAIAIELLRGSVEEHYASLRRYIAELRKVDRGGRYELLLGDAAVFKGLYMGFSSLVKDLYLGGILMCAVGKDGNNQIFPIAWAIVEVENEQCWTWFLKCLIEDLGIADGAGWTFISDQQKGLLNAVNTLTPFAEHKNCACDVYMNWNKLHKGQTLKNLLWKYVRSTYVEEYKSMLEDMKAESRAAYEDFIERDIKKFCKAFVVELLER